jgi:hypothetical protein
LSAKELKIRKKWLRTWNEEMRSVIDEMKKLYRKYRPE